MGNHYNNIATGMKKNRKRSVTLGLVACLILICFTLGSLTIIFTREDLSDTSLPLSIPSTAKADAQQPGKPPANRSNGLWDGPVLYHHPANKPIFIALVEKSTQKLHLYRYDGRYEKLKTYACATGEQRGKKRLEKDEKTPEGIYFNNITYRDKKITVFGDRAFGLNYPDTFDLLTGNKGGGIFIHGSNREVKPFSTNGCIVLKNSDLADLDKRVNVRKTTVIIGERLPYRYAVAKGNIPELIPFLMQAMLPEKYAQMTPEYESLSIFGFEDRIVATGDIRIPEAGNIQGTSRLYLAGPAPNLLVLIKREWSEEKSAILAKQSNTNHKKAAAKKKRPPTEKEKVRRLLESWRRSWEKKQLDSYLSHYHPDFVSRGRNLKEWKNYKDSLNRRYKKITVGLSDIRFEISDKRARVYFKQRYRSDAFRANSYKKLELRKNGKTWKIYREDSYAKKPDNWPS